MKQIKTVIIGFGGMGSQYAQMIYQGSIPGMILTGVCCRNAQGQETLAKEYPGISIYPSIDHVLEHSRDFDLAVVVTPHTSHVEIGLKLVQAGKHILLDKPAGVSAREVRTLVQAAKDKQVSFGMMVNIRMAPAFQKAKELLTQNALGTITRAVWICNTWFRTPVYHASAPWRSSWKGECGGLLINQSQHYLDIWQWLLGMPDAVLATLEYGKYNDFDVDDSAELQFFYQNGLRGTFISSTGENPGINRLDIWGTKGRLSIDDTSRLTFDENVMPIDEFAKSNREIYGVLEHRLREIPLEAGGNGYQKVFSNYADHLLKGTPLMADGTDGLNTIVITNGAYLSSWLEQKITLPADEDLFLEKLKEKQKS